MASLNIILFGEAGAGKSSVINLIAGREVAKTSSGAAACTMSFNDYTFTVGERRFHIWDTVGLNEPDMELGAIEQVWSLIRALSDEGGVDLLLFCIRPPRVTATMQMNYRLFYEVLCRSRVPIGLVITHLEEEKVMEHWWIRNSEGLQRYDLVASGHACVSGLLNHVKYNEARENIHALLKSHDSTGRFTMPPAAWFIQFLCAFGFLAPLKEKPRVRDILRVLTLRCHMDQKVAEQLALSLVE